MDPGTKLKSVAKSMIALGHAVPRPYASDQPSVDYLDALDIIATGMRLLKSHDRKHWAVLLAPSCPRIHPVQWYSL